MLMALPAIAVVITLGAGSWQRFCAPARQNPAQCSAAGNSKTGYPAARKIDTGELNVNDAVRMANGRGSRVLYVFSRTDCVWSRKLQNTLAKIDDLTVFTFLVPGRNQQSREKGTVLPRAAGENNAHEYDTAMLDRNLEKMRRFGFAGVPTAIMSDGTVLTGSTEAEVLEHALALKAALKLDRPFSSVSAAAQKMPANSLHAREETDRKEKSQQNTDSAAVHPDVT